MPDIVITALDDPVAIVHIPIELVEAYTTKLYWTLDGAARDSPEFFNITSNRVEMAVFGSVQLISQEWSDVAHADVLISSDWRVYEITSGDEDDVGNYDSPHLRHVSSPLARAGISILYQSSYFTDFLLVKESDFERASEIFTEQGWNVVGGTASPTMDSRSLSSGPSHGSGSPHPQPEITVLPRPLACVGLSKLAQERLDERIRKFLVWPERAVAGRTMAKAVTDDSDSSESEAEVASFLSSELSPRRERTRSRSTSPARKRPFVCYTRNEDGVSLLTEVRVLRAMFPRGDMGEDDVQSGGELDWIEDQSLQESDDDDENDWIEWEVKTPLDDEQVAGDLGSYVKGHRKSMSLPCTPLSLHDRAQVDKSLELLPYSPSLSGSLSSSLTAATVLPPTASLGMEMTVSMVRPPPPVVELPITWFGKDVKREGKGKKRCLQLDLRSINEGELDSDCQSVYHLDKSGLVTRFSSLLASSVTPIRMLYSSTFHTANVLVESRDVKRAKRLLERRRSSSEWC
nr:hypothetical protein L204_05439 [Cryptococcus depauperatus CBS 7855]